ncbi:glycosyltransferase N-terminal domain-containing protein [Pelagimonas sp. KU-00592-HH]
MYGGRGMTRSLGLSAYLAFARRQASTLEAISEQRPDGGLLWLHCSEPERITALAQLGLRLIGLRGGLSLMLSTSPGTKRPANLPDKVIWQEGPSENPADIRLFLDHWKPDASLWLGPYLRPALIDAAHRRDIPIILADTYQVMIENSRWRVIPDPVKATLAHFKTILAGSSEAYGRLRRLFPTGDKVQESGPLLEDCPALPHSETDLEDLSETLSGRPLWLASRLQLTELRSILSAHRAVGRLTHRMLLVVIPDNAADAPRFLEAIREDGWRVACWDDGEFPDTNTQVVLSGDPRERGLWYRVAPVTFLGSSLAPGHGGRNPFEPAALGSAVLYGPGVRRHLGSYTRLAKAGAARIVRDTDSLATALSHLTAPDQAATMAHAGWETVSEGAEVSDQIITLVQDTLDEKGLS